MCKRIDQKMIHAKKEDKSMLDWAKREVEIACKKKMGSMTMDALVVKVH